MTRKLTILLVIQILKFVRVRTNVRTMTFVWGGVCLMSFQYVGFASFVVLVWDHIDTFADEVSG